MDKILNGNKVSKFFLKKIKKKINKIKENNKNINPHLGIIIVGKNIQSINYVKNKIKDCKKIGIKVYLLEFPISISEKELIFEIKNLNNNPLIDGFIIQLPLPKILNIENIILHINPNKDVDGFHPINLGKLSLNYNDKKIFIPATALGIFKLLNFYKINTLGKHIVVIGRSRIVGTPISILMSRKNMGNSTVTITHSYTKNLIYFTKKADILISSIGKPNFIKKNMIKNKSIIIDVGINENKYKKIVGDVDFKNVYKKVSYITPVPGGVGPMTRAMLIYNTYLSFIKNNKLNNKYNYL
ncbi:bifunctional 5,10-methylenetetrahydrofolate dehydrogenase/5,10-methenyltetrahydrofolate cyclohydrolase [Candidatus Shikimatogenerans silvanidophilus]|uniref:bifunctional 5,10-methylenetetrahydrofolate dehydrogenase/5,10-methenyltetrahydrofolate cyclohydrolase n=1 Tax=Candidatus Shikimatogenerans silvanidophilus TaxID=2782547 RepID=UPI001BA74150|nr:bifunctional 5,10-methylenetetrahydrofolate dehydrogenase/5,10-methenyltetrahydrofolate cyclohydrolase [Candidatus Shikimatogenerans silvanidophilus]